MDDQNQPLKDDRLRPTPPTIVQPTTPPAPEGLPVLPETPAHPAPVLLATKAADDSKYEIQTSREKHGAFRELLSTIGILTTALVVALLMIMFVFRSYQVDGPSMEKALYNADKLIIWKVPRTWAKITHNAYIPNRGDIIIFSETGLSQFGM